MSDLDLAVAAAGAGASVVREHFGKATRTELKATFNPVTDVDRAAEVAILDVIRQHRPGDTIVAEEGGGSGSGGRTWFVDPLDGTVNFVHGIPHIAVSVGLYEDGEGLVGVVHDVMRGELWTAVPGEGTRLDGARVNVSETKQPDQAVVATGFPYDHGRYAVEYAATLASVLAEVNGIRRFGSAALDLAWTAGGRYDAYFELDVAPWDQAAGIVLVREAGGVVTLHDGAPSAPAHSSVVSSNGLLHDRLLELIGGALPEHIGRPAAGE